MHTFKFYHQQSGIAQIKCSSRMMADLYLYYHEKIFTNNNNNNIHLYRYVDNIILISTNSFNCLFPVNYPANL